MKIHVIGCGAMGRAMAQGLAKAECEIVLYDRHPEKAQALAKTINATVAKQPLEHHEKEDWLLLAVKPASFEETAKALSGFNGALVISVMMGITIDQLKRAFPHAAILRTMPNLAVAYGKGVVALAGDTKDSSVEQIFAPLGYLHWLEESQFPAFTSLAGSGPAFVLAFLEAMRDSGVKMGLSQEQSLQLSQKTIEGALALLEHSGQSPEEIRGEITSRGGSTQAGLEAFASTHVPEGINATFQAAFKRAQA